MRFLSVRNLRPLALLMTLTACGDDWEGYQGTMRVKHGDTWKDFTRVRDVREPLILPDGHGGPYELLHFCGADVPNPEKTEGETGFCVFVALEDSARATGPATFTLDGSAEVPRLGYRVLPDFTAGPSHTPGVGLLWTETTCPPHQPSETAPQQLSGQLVLEENSWDGLKGFLKLSVTGTTGGACAGEAAELDIGFDFNR